MWTYPCFYETFCLLHPDNRSVGRSGLLPAEWAETMGLLGTFFCCSLSHSSLSQGGNDRGHSLHTGFKFLFFKQKDEDSYDDHVPCMSGAAAGPLKCFVCLKHCGGNVQAADLGHGVHICECMCPLLGTFTSQHSQQPLLLPPSSAPFGGDSWLLSWRLDHPGVIVVCREETSDLKGPVT